MNLTTVSTLGVLATVILVLGTLGTFQTVHAQNFSIPGCPRCSDFFKPVDPNDFTQFCLDEPCGNDNGNSIPGSPNDIPIPGDIKNKLADRLNTVADQINDRFDQIEQRLSSIPNIPH